MYAYLTFATPHQPSRGEYLREGQWEDLGTSRPKHLAWCSWAAVLFSRVWWGGSGDHAADRYRRRPAHLTGACCDPPAKLPALAALARRGAPGRFTSVTGGQDKPADGFFNALYGEPAISAIFVSKPRIHNSPWTGNTKRVRPRHLDFLPPPHRLVP